MLIGFIFLPIVAGLLGWLLEGRFHFVPQKDHPKSLLFYIKKECLQFTSFWLALVSLIISFGMAIYWLTQAINMPDGQIWEQVINVSWIPLLGIQFHIVLDSLALLFILLSQLIALIAIVYSHSERKKESALFYLALLFVVSFATLLFMAEDLFLFIFLWELVAIPFYFLISLWGRRDTTTKIRFHRVRKFIFYSQISSLIMLVSLIVLAYMNYTLSGEWTFNYTELSKAPISIDTELYLMLGFLIAFFVRMPVFPFHSWFVDAHVESSTTTSIMISGILTNSAIYTLIKIIIPLFPNASIIAAPWVSGLALFTLFYTTLFCLKKTDIKKLIAYVNLALNGLVISAIYCNTLQSLQGTILLLIGTTLAIASFFIISGVLTRHYLTRNITYFRGLKYQIKYLSTVMILFTLILAGLPGTVNFTGLSLIVTGSFSDFPYQSLLMILGSLLLSFVLIIQIHPAFYGEEMPNVKAKSLPLTELILLIGVLFILFLIGFYPQWILDASSVAMTQIQDVLSNAETNQIQEMTGAL